MKKLIILSLLAICSYTFISAAAANETRVTRAIRATKTAFRNVKSYLSDAASDWRFEIKDIADEIGQQYKELGHDIYESVIAPVLGETTTTAQNIGTSVKNSAQNTYQNVVYSPAVAEAQEIAGELQEQLTEIGQELYENGVRNPIITCNEKAAAVATAIREKVAAAKNATAQVAIDAKNSELGQDMADVGAQFKEAAQDITTAIQDKSTQIWNSTKETVQEIRTELAN